MIGFKIAICLYYIFQKDVTKNYMKENQQGSSTSEMYSKSGKKLLLPLNHKTPCHGRKLKVKGAYINRISSL